MSQPRSDIVVIDLDTTSESDTHSATSETHNVGSSAKSKKISKNRQIQPEAISKPQFLQLLTEAESVTVIQTLYPRSLWHEEYNAITNECEAEALSCATGRTPQSKRVPKVYNKGDNFLEIHLTGFCAYNSINSTRYVGQFESLDTIASKCRIRGKTVFCLDGHVQLPDGSSTFVSGMIIRNVSIGALEEAYHTVRDHVWIQTIQGAQYDDCWYKLCAPAPEYSKHWENFLWIADLSKHTIDFLTHQSAPHISLHHFRSSFYEHLFKLHHSSSDFQTWSTGVGKDFRKQIIRHRIFLRDQAHNVDIALLENPLWQDIGVEKLSLDQQRFSKTRTAQTVLTAHIARSFLKVFPHWGSGPDGLDLIHVVRPSHIVFEERDMRRFLLGFPDRYADQQTEGPELSPLQQLHNDVVGSNGNTGPTVPLQDVTNRVVAVRTASTVRFALVLDIIPGWGKLRVAWLVTPQDTICGDKRHQASYPFIKELFLIDECNCGAVDYDDVLRIFTVSLFTDTAENCQTFIRSRFLSRQQAIVHAHEFELKQGCPNRGCVRNSTSMDRRASYQQQPQHEDLMQLNVPTPTLSNLSLFTGAGLLDTGMEQDGLIRTVSSIDQCELAILSARANHGGSDDFGTTFTIGSVDSDLHDRLTGTKPYAQYDIISSGCPCQGFSQLNNKKTSRSSQKNVSLLASTLSYVDCFLPRYVVIENVPAMDRDSPACAQAICELVALGYQVQKCVMKAFDYGGCTKRERLFILAAAPGHILPDPVQDGDGNGGINLRQAMDDLEPITNDTWINTRRPDHIPVERYKVQLKNECYVSIRDIVTRISKSPYGQGLFESQEHLSPSQKQWYKAFGDINKVKAGKGSKMLRRVHPDKPFPTVVTRVDYSDARHTGEILHYDQDRSLSLEELRRAQGLPDSFLLVGNILDQLKQLGNRVPFALGTTIGRAVGVAERARPRLQFHDSVDNEIRDGHSVRRGENEDQDSKMIDLTDSPKDHDGDVRMEDGETQFDGGPDAAFASDSDDSVILISARQIEK